MIWVVIAVVVVIWFGVYAYRELDFGIVPTGLMSILLLVVASLFVTLLIAAPSEFIEREHLVYEKTETNISALNDSMGVNGRTGFLGSGYIDTGLYYFYAEETDLGTAIRKVPASKSYIKYSDECKVETYTAVDFKNKWRYAYAMPMDTYYVIYVPEGTIIENYQIDMQ